MAGNKAPQGCYITYGKKMAKTCGSG